MCIYVCEFQPSVMATVRVRRCCTFVSKCVVYRCCCTLLISVHHVCVCVRCLMFHLAAARVCHATDSVTVLCARVFTGYCSVKQCVTAACTLYISGCQEFMLRKGISRYSGHQYDSSVLPHTRFHKQQVIGRSYSTTKYSLYLSLIHI